MNPDLNQLKKDIKKLDSYRVITSDELSSFLNDVANILNQWKSATFSVNKETKDTLNLIVKQVNEEHDRILKEVNETQGKSKSDLTEEFNNSLKQSNLLLKKIKAVKIVNGTDGLDGANGIDGKNGKDGKDGSPDTAKDIKEKIETLKGNERLDKSAIKGLENTVTSQDLTRAISILDQRTQFLINKQSSGGSAVTTVAVATANGLAGLSDGNPTNPTLTLSTTVTGLLKGNGATISATTANVDYQVPIALTTIGSSGVATFNGTTLNVPNYSSGSGGITRSVLSVSSPTTLGTTASTDYVYFVSGTTTVTLPTAIGNTNRYTIVHTDTNTMTIATTSSQTIAFYPPSPATTATVTVQGTVVELFSDGSNWWTI